MLKERRQDDAFEKMSASWCRPQSKNRVDMNARLAIIADRDIAYCAQDLALFVYRDFAVGLRSQIELADGGFSKAPIAVKEALSTLCSPAKV